MPRPRVTRRTFVAGAAATGAALAAGCGGADGARGGPRRVIVIGAGMAGLGAAGELRRAGVEPIVLEARPRIGGRVHTVGDLGAPVDLGAAWIHDSKGNPLTGIARGARLATVPTDYESVALRSPGGAVVAESVLEAAARADASIERALAAAAQDADPEDPLAPALRRARAATGVTGTTASTLDWILGNGIPLDLAADVGELSVLGYDEGETYDGGDDLLLRRGAGALIETLARGITIRRATPVRAVRRRADGVTVVTAGGEHLRADGCVVTVPLGVLQAGAVRFDPPLPADARGAIRRLGFGLLDKVILRYEQAWWPDVATIGTVGTSIGETISTFNITPVTGLPILVAFTGGRYARTLERRSDAEIVGTVTSSLASGFGEPARRPAATLVTRWAAEPYTRGSYSFLPPGASEDDRIALGARAGRVVLAGEHTSVERPATMDGALRAGRTAGRAMARAVL